MGKLLKQAFGLVTIILGVVMATVAIGQKWFAPDDPFNYWMLFGGLFWGLVCFRFGRKWMFNLIDLDVIGVEPGDPAIEAAKRRAHDSLNTLWSYLEKNRHECFVKFSMATESGGVEHIWAVVHSRKDNSVVVSLANEPLDESVDSSVRSVVAISDIEDWQVFVSESEIRGGYSIGALAEIARSRGYRISRSDRKKLEPFVDLTPSEKRL